MPPIPSAAVIGFAQVIAGLLKLFGDRTVAFAAALLPLIAVAATFFLVLQVLDNPTVLKLIAVGGFAAFMLALIWIRRRT